jgi:hypothetical protein
VPRNIGYNYINSLEYIELAIIKPFTKVTFVNSGYSDVKRFRSIIFAPPTPDLYAPNLIFIVLASFVFGTSRAKFRYAMGALG